VNDGGKGRTARAARVPELDGLRGVAVLLVVVAHLAVGEIPVSRPLIPALRWPHPGGGFIGVQLFFVLSGYLITSILARELDTTGRLRFKAFYARRVRRLLPALVVVVIAYLVIEAVFYPDQMPGAVGASIYALTYTGDLSSFIHPIANAGYLDHTWSLAVEEQFYLLWPVLLVVSRRWRRQGPAIVALSGLVITLALRQFAGIPPSIVYTTMRWDALFMGCLLALVPVRLPRGSGVIAAAVIAAFAIYTPGPVPNWAYAAGTLACAAALATASRGRWLRNPVLRHFGRISYGLYLWHVLLLEYLIPTWVALVLSVAAAEISFHFVETRFLRPSRTFVPAPGEDPAVEGDPTSDDDPTVAS
jgi:peptidoglycan/LPS O-acetylase OafA/YrhL